MVGYEGYYTAPMDDTDLVPTYEYAASAQTMKMRLEILGYTLEKVKALFIPGLEEIIENQREFYEEHLGAAGYKTIENLTFLKEGGFDNWLNLVSQIFDRNLQTWNLDSGRDRMTDSIPIFLVDHYSDEMYLGYPSMEMGYLVRAMLEAVKPEDELILDITSLVSAGYYEENEAVCDRTIEGQINSVIQFKKIIILTEGTSDSSILSKALIVLYPELTHYFSFMDFNTMSSEGGSSALERTVKSFAAAGINNRIIALFDNDATGVTAFNRVKRIPLPDNIKVLTLPYLPLASAYPTAGPQGLTVEDVNGRACSIEMYLGADILIDTNGYIPVNWRSFEQQIKEYQGEISKKGEIQDKFKKKIALAQNTTSLSGDWSGLQLIFQSVFKEVATW
ncbi:MAG: hypothetical protein JWR38_1318 [Mucilaginibacter sp.]|nr:hypothetical protein [Mucilaginibacter sp.]